MVAALHSPWVPIAMDLAFAVFSLVGAVMMIVVPIFGSLDHAVSPWPQVWFLSLVVRPDGWHRFPHYGLAAAGVFAIAGWFYWLNAPRRKLGGVERAIPRKWARTVIWSSRAAGVVGIVIALESIVLTKMGAPNSDDLTQLIQLRNVAVPFGAFLAVWGFFAARQSANVEFGANGLRIKNKFHKWTALGKFEWSSSKSGAAILRIEIKEQPKPGKKSDVQIRLAEDRSVEGILLAHGLERW